MKYPGIAIAWFAFMAAALEEVLVFSYVNPQELFLLGWVNLPPLGIYTLAFFCFWLCCGLAGWMSYHWLVVKPVK